MVGIRNKADGGIWQMDWNGLECATLVTFGENIILWRGRMVAPSVMLHVIRFFRNPNASFSIGRESSTSPKYIWVCSHLRAQAGLAFAFLGFQYALRKNVLVPQHPFAEL